MIDREKHPAVSIVIPTYNHAPYLKKALHSVIAQTFEGWEAIVINNYSEDDTESVVKEFDDPRIRLFNFRNHGIIAASRNEGIRKARAEVVAFLDSDDLWYPSKLDKCLETLMARTDLVCHGELWTGDAGPGREFHYGPESKATYGELLYNGNCLSPSAVLVKKAALEKVGGFSEEPEFVTAEDYDLWLKLAREGYSFKFIDEILGEYRLHETNESRALNRNMKAILAVVEHHFALNSRPNLMEMLRMRQRKALVYFSFARAYQKMGKMYEATRHYCKAIMIHPFVPILYLGMNQNFFSTKTRTTEHCAC